MLSANDMKPGLWASFIWNSVTAREHPVIAVTDAIDQVLGVSAPAGAPLLILPPSR
jgi:hypothetical protein